MKEVLETLANIGLFQGYDLSEFSFGRLGGLTNRNFKVVDGEKGTC